MTYEEVRTKIENARRFGRLPGATVTREILKKLRHPAAHIPYIHVAGTNGKGSVCAFLTSILRMAGYRVGTFTSPHLVDFEERITVDGRMISKERVRQLGEELLAHDFGVEPTMFDYCLAMALQYFDEQSCDVMVIETGLGGRLDSTNAIGVPRVSVITKIGFDHMAILGDTLAQIASEKAGIIKDGSALVLQRQEKEAMQVLQREAAKHDLNSVQIVDDEALALVLSCHMRLWGVHQLENAAAAILAAENFLSVDGRELSEEALRSAVEQTVWPGRMELVCSAPFFMVDGAHNGHGVHALAESLRSMYPGEKFHLVMGVMADKDYACMVEELLPLALDFRTVTPESSRALQAGQLADFIRAKGVPTDSYADVAAMLTDILSDRQRTHKTIAFGSLYFIGEIKALLRDKKC